MPQNDQRRMNKRGRVQSWKFKWRHNEIIYLSRSIDACSWSVTQRTYWKPHPMGIAMRMGSGCRQEQQTKKRHCPTCPCGVQHENTLYKYITISCIIIISHIFILYTVWYCVCVKVFAGKSWKVCSRQGIGSSSIAQAAHQIEINFTTHNAVFYVASLGAFSSHDTSLGSLGTGVKLQTKHLDSLVVALSLQSHDCCWAVSDAVTASQVSRKLRRPETWLLGSRCI